MIVKELITKLLEFDMYSEVRVAINKKHINEYGNEVDGYQFDIESIDDFGGIAEIVFEDWRDDDIKNLSDIKGTCLNDTDIKFDIPNEDSVSKTQKNALSKSIAEWNKAIEKRGYIN